MNDKDIERYAKEYTSDIIKGKKKIPSYMEFIAYCAIRKVIEDILMPHIYKHINLIAKYKLIMRY